MDTNDSNDDSICIICKDDKYLKIKKEYAYFSKVIKTAFEIYEDNDDSKLCNFPLKHLDYEWVYRTFEFCRIYNRPYNIIFRKPYTFVDVRALLQQWNLYFSDPQHFDPTHKDKDKEWYINEDKNDSEMIILNSNYKCNIVIQLVKIADYLDIYPLYQFGTLFIAYFMDKCIKNDPNYKKTLNIVEDIPIEEQEQIKKLTKWCQKF